MLTVSVIIPTFNGARTIAWALAAVAAQTQRDALCEVVVVDNASTDDTAMIAQAAWRECGATGLPLRVIHEPCPGAQRARMRGFAAAQGDVYVLLDDDNGLAPDYVKRALVLLAARPEVVGCGGRGVLDGVAAPSWFAPLQDSFACGPQRQGSGDVTERALWGAGLVLRAAALRGVLAAGWRPRLAGRVGNRYTAGGDSELCFALALAGGRLWYDEDLVYLHRVHPDRFSWAHMRKVHRGFGLCDPVLARYGVGPTLPMRRQTLRRLFTRLPARLRNRTGDMRVLEWDRAVGRLRGYVAAPRTFLMTKPWS